MTRWPDASVRIATIAALAFAYWVRKAYDKTPITFRIETDEAIDNRDPDMLLQTLREPDEY